MPVEHREEMGVESRGTKPDGELSIRSLSGRYVGRCVGMSARGVSDGRVSVNDGKGGKDEMRSVVAILLVVVVVSQVSEHTQ